MNDPCDQHLIQSARELQASFCAPITNDNGAHIRAQADMASEDKRSPVCYGTTHVAVTDGLIDALDFVTDLYLPTAIYTELLCLKVQALVMRERAKRGRT